MSDYSLQVSLNPRIIKVSPAHTEELKMETNETIIIELPSSEIEQEGTSSSVDVQKAPIHPTSAPSTIDPQLISDVLSMRPTLVLGRSNRAQTAGVSRKKTVRAKSFHQRRPHTTAGGARMRRTSSLPMLANQQGSSSSTITLEDIEEISPYDNERDDDPFTRGNIRRSTRKIKDRIRTYKQEHIVIPKEFRHSFVADFRYVKWPKIKSRLQVIRSWELWKGHMKEVEGHFGTAVVSYFIFLRWLFIMNIVIFALWFGLVVIPNAAFISLAQPPHIPSSLTCSYDNSILPTPNYTCNDDFDNGALSPALNNTVYLLSGSDYSCNSTNDVFSIRSCLFESRTVGNMTYNVAHKESTEVVSVSGIPPTDCINATNVVALRVCSSDIDPHVEWYQYVINFFLGEGIFNDTVLFHGRYSDSTVFVYNLPLAFMLLIVVVYAISIILLVYNLGNAYNESYLQFGKKRQINFCNKVFSAWDFNITDTNTAKLKKVQIKTDLQEELADWEQRNKHRSGKELAKVIAIRIVTNLFTLLVLIGGGVAIFYAAQFSLTTQSSISFISLEGLVSPVVITVFNLFFPFIFSFLAQFERFKTQSGEIKMTLFRTVIVRLASLIVLIGTLYIVIQCTQQVDSTNSNNLPEGTCGLSSINVTDLFSGFTTNQACPECWETYIGQEFYKLAITNILISSASTLGVEMARNVISRIHWKGIGEKIGKGNFNIPKSILDLIYTQALLWLGFIFTPLTPALIMITTFLFFYIKKYSLIWNLEPSKRKSFRAARTNFVFIAIMLFVLFLVIIVIGIAIASLHPSPNCGPFRGRTYMYSIITDLIEEIENCSTRQALEYFGSFGFLLPVFIFLVLVIYAQQVTLRARKKRFNLVKKQLLLEGANVTHIVGTLDEVLHNLGTENEQTDLDPEQHKSLKSRMERVRKSSEVNYETMSAM